LLRLAEALFADRRSRQWVLEVQRMAVATTKALESETHTADSLWMGLSCAGRSKLAAIELDRRQQLATIEERT